MTKSLELDTEMRWESADFIGARSRTIGCNRLMARTPAPFVVHTFRTTFGKFDMPALTIGLDIAKHVFQVHGVDRSGKTVIQRKLRRAEVLKFFSKLEPGLVGLEACCEFPAYRRHFVFGVMAPPDFRRNGATAFSA
jgi:hypothetical protein